MSPGMLRAREPFRVKNAVTGVLLAAFGVGVWAYSIRAVKQDVFDDVDEEARALATARRQSLAEQERSKIDSSPR
jgi:cytochrome c oxidase assembly factor 3, fungi type